MLDAGGPALEAVVDAVAVMEDSGVFNAGVGGSRTITGELELDAAVMDGRSGCAGAVCATTWPRNPVRVALAVSESGSAPDGPLLLAGAGADLFAADRGFPEMGANRSNPILGSPAGTVGAVAVDSERHLAAATSTGGRQGQLRGRVGDSPIIGAGTWADDATAAVSATGEGEAFVLAGFAHLLDWVMRDGASLDTAVVRSMAEVSRRGGEGGSIAMTTSGELVCVFGTRAMARTCGRTPVCYEGRGARWLAGRQSKCSERTGSAPVNELPLMTRHATGGMVSSIDHLASEAGVACLRSGGSAADAAVAASAVLAVTSPHMCGMGGDLFALVSVPGELETPGAKCLGPSRKWRGPGKTAFRRKRHDAFQRRPQIRASSRLRGRMGRAARPARPASSP